MSTSGLYLYSHCRQRGQTELRSMLVDPTQVCSRITAHWLIIPIGLHIQVYWNSDCLWFLTETGTRVVQPTTFEVPLTSVNLAPWLWAFPTATPLSDIRCYKWSLSTAVPSSEFSWSLSSWFLLGKAGINYQPLQSIVSTLPFYLLCCSVEASGITNS